MIDFPEFNQNTNADIKLAMFIFFIGSPADVTATPLEFFTKFFL